MPGAVTLPLPSCRSCHPRRRQAAATVALSRRCNRLQVVAAAKLLPPSRCQRRHHRAEPVPQHFADTKALATQLLRQHTAAAQPQPQQPNITVHKRPCRCCRHHRAGERGTGDDADASLFALSPLSLRYVVCSTTVIAIARASKGQVLTVATPSIHTAILIVTTHADHLQSS